MQDQTKQKEQAVQQTDSMSKNKKDKTRLKKILSAVLLITFNVVAVVVVLLMELNADHGAMQSIKNVLNMMGQNYEFIILALMLYALHLFSNSLAIYSLISQCGYGKRVGLAIRTAILGKYYDSITPWNMGGVPSQIAYLLASNVDAPSACSLPVVKYTIRIISINVSVAIMFIIVAVDIGTVIRIGAYMGLVTTLLLPLLLIIFSRNVPLMLRLARVIVRFLHKIKLVKDVEKQLLKAQDLMDSFLAAYKYLAKHKYMIVIIAIASIVDYVAIAAIPFAVLNALGGDISEFVRFLTKSFYLTLASGVVPTPGASGAAEGTFYSVFSAASPVGYLFWAVLFWRILVFYLPILLGILVQTIDWIKGKSKIALVTNNANWSHKKTFFNKIGAKKDDEE